MKTVKKSEAGGMDARNAGSNGSKARREASKMANRVEIYRQQKRCVKCGKRDERTNQGKWHCEECAAAMREYQRKFNAKRMEQYYRNKENGVCAKCGAPLDNETTWCNFCRIKQAEATRRYEGRLRDAQG
jgi:predicted amidophosphoribosyltransferase